MPSIYSELDGWFDYQEFYDSMLDKFKEGGHFVEVGCWFGKSGIYLAEKIKEENLSIRVDYVDHWLGDINVPYQQELIKDNGKDFIFDSFVASLNKANPSHNGKVIRKESIKASLLYDDCSLDFVYIDAGHVYADVYADITNWLPKVKVGGILAGHDYEYGDVARAVSELLTDVTSPFSHGHVWSYEKKS